MNCSLAWLAGLALLVASPLAAQTVPQFAVDPSWPKALPNNWLLGQVAHIAVDANDHVWVLQHPRTLSDDEKGATLKPPRNKCCAPAPSVMARTAPPVETVKMVMSGVVFTFCRILSSVSLDIVSRPEAMRMMYLRPSMRLVARAGSPIRPLRGRSRDGK